MKEFKHFVQYYETDRMGITHHSNYIRWMEEARIDFLNQLGWPYEKLEEEGIVSPVTAIDCKYLSSTTFPDEVSIRVIVSEYNGVVLKLHYHMTKADGKKVFEGHSEHCFLNKSGRFIRMKKEYPEIYNMLLSQVMEAV